MAFLQGFFDFRCAERGELGGKTWWSCGETVVEITSKSAPLQQANFFAHFRFFCGTEGRLKDRLAIAGKYHAAARVVSCCGTDSPGLKLGKKMAN
jgi:hypothetical protein